MQSRIIFNGQEYHSIDEMPADVRATYQKAMAVALADSDKNGIPDVLEGKSAAGVNVTTKIVSKIVVNGKEYKSLDEVPADIRHLIEAARPAAKPGVRITIRPGHLALLLLIVLLVIAVLVFMT